MRQPFAHEAVVVLEGEGDPRTLGATITVGLCGSWDHEPPCPLAPHHTGFQRTGQEVQLRVLFAADPSDEVKVRQEIDAALSSSVGVDAEGRRTRWTLARSGPAEVRHAESSHARRLAQG